MVFEMACARGTRIWLNGESSKTRWSSAQDGNTLKTNDLVIGQRKVDEVEVIGPESDDNDPLIGSYYVFRKALVPNEIVLRTAKETWRGPVLITVTGDEDSETKVTLYNGETFDVDEITLYLRATLSRIN